MAISACRGDCWFVWMWSPNDIKICLFGDKSIIFRHEESFRFFFNQSSSLLLHSDLHISIQHIILKCNDETNRNHGETKPRIVSLDGCSWKNCKEYSIEVTLIAEPFSSHGHLCCHHNLSLLHGNFFLLGHHVLGILFHTWCHSIWDGWCYTSHPW